MPTRFPTGVSYLRPDVAANSGTYTFTAGDQTPDVGKGSIFLTNVGSGITITNFDGGETGQQIYVFSASAGVTTIQDSAGGIRTSRLVIAPFASGSGLTVTTAGDLILQANELVSFIHLNGTWYQQDKSVQL